MSPIEMQLPPPPSVIKNPAEKPFISSELYVTPVPQPMEPFVPAEESIFNQTSPATPQLSIEDRINRLEEQFGGLNNQFSNINSLISGPFSGGYGSSYGNNPFGYGGRPSFSPFSQSPFGQSSFPPMMYGGIGGFMPYFG